MRWCSLTLILLVLAGCGMTPEEALSATIADMRLLLEAGSTEELVDAYFEPRWVAKRRADGSLEVFVEELYRERGLILQADLYRLEGLDPVVSDDGTSAVFTDPELPRGRVVFVQDHDRWYLRYRDAEEDPAGAP